MSGRSGRSAREAWHGCCRVSWAPSMLLQAKPAGYQGNRPHIKTHKSPILAHMQIDAGARGITCQKLGEAEVMADAGITDIVIATNLLGAALCGKLAALQRRVPLKVCADMYAIRLASAYTGKPKVLKFEGGYHGMSAEAQMSLAPSKQVNFLTAVPDNAGIPQGVVDEMLIAPFNDLEAVASLLGEHGDVAAIIAEPLQRIIPAQPGFLQGLRDLCDTHEVLLIFDEIVIGFRLAYGGAQERFGMVPDICTLGKFIGGGFPLAALGASAEIMAHFDKAVVGADKWLMQLGTLSGNPVASAAGLKTMETLWRPGQYERLRDLGQTLMDMQSAALEQHGVRHRICGDPTLFDIYFTDADPVDYRTAKHRDPGINEVWNTTLRANGVFKSPGKLYPSLALMPADFDLTRSAFSHAAIAVADAMVSHR
ncbi:MAG: aminotransferase class III-fold pyridoxal phosphate-dependent enzyme [Silicimonas sp.]|nr:aminotransferase class III-fold pyridoxal phosphate-dependent enzyme [Silicimonas sp.]